MGDRVYEFLRKKGLAGYGNLSSDLPCYAELIPTDHRINKIADIREYLSAALKDVDGTGDNTGTGILCVSIRTIDPDYRKWLKAAKEFPGAVVTISRTKWHQGTYKCFFVTIPVNSKLK